MPSLEEHCRIDVEDLHLSRSYPEIHQFLDQFAHYPDWNFLKVHRRFLHHVEGVEYVRRRWGDEAAQAAVGHILEDTELDEVPHAVDYWNGTLDGLGRPARPPDRKSGWRETLKRAVEISQPPF